jgi:hypothetical protein
MEVSGQLHVLAALISMKETPVPVGWEAGWAPNKIWTCGEKKQPLPLSGIEPSFPVLPVRNQVIILSFPGSTERKIKYNMNWNNGDILKWKKARKKELMKIFYEHYRQNYLRSTSMLMFTASIATYNFKITSLYAGRPSCCQSASNATLHNQNLTHPQCYSSNPIPTAQRRQNGAVMTSERRHRRIARAGTENGQRHREVICSSFLILVIYTQTSDTDRFMSLNRA